MFGQGHQINLRVVKAKNYSLNSMLLFEVISSNFLLTWGYQASYYLQTRVKILLITPKKVWEDKILMPRRQYLNAELVKHNSF